MTGDQHDQAIEMLAEGLGVEDIALRLSVPLLAVQILVAELRDMGLLDAIFERDAE